MTSLQSLNGDGRKDEIKKKLIVRVGATEGCWGQWNHVEEGWCCGGGIGKGAREVLGGRAVVETETFSGQGSCRGATVEGWGRAFMRAGQLKGGAVVGAGQLYGQGRL